MKLTFHYLAILNLLDGLLSFLGLNLSLMQEANPIMNELYTIHPFLFLTVKATFSIVLYLFIIYNKIPTKLWFKSLTYLASTLYTATLFLHVAWIYQAFN
ncbi:DUF5658 family protein [Bacillus pinisoli]|uniref:DUF5658 family protein n=1 Tax=Bacillus pinisoli TaxID=2901866 RepID=UPI001FF69B3D|nr:DUF5658 family protein [Bacillus pinisoli]